MFKPGHKSPVRRFVDYVQIRGNESDAIAKLQPTLEAQGRMVVGRAVIRKHLRKGVQRGYVLDFGRLGGKRQRLHVKTATEAINKARSKTAEINEHGKLALGLEGRQRIEAVACIQRLKAVGCSLTDAVTYFLDRHPKSGMGRTLDQVVEELTELKRQGGRKKRYVEDLSAKLWRLVKFLPNRPIASIEVGDIEEYLERHPNWAPRTVSSVVQSFKVLFYYGMKRGYCTENPCSRIEIPKADDKEVEIATIEQVRKILSLAKGGECDHDATLYLAIGFFTGIRPDEIQKLQWNQIDFENKTVTVLSSSAKGRARRIVDMSENLIAWISNYKKDSGPVIDIGVSVLRKQIRNAMGWKRWPHNVMRHSFASYHFMHHRNEALLKQLMGHGDDGRILHNHYRALVQPKAAREFWEIYPSTP